MGAKNSKRILGWKISLFWEDAIWTKRLKTNKALVMIVFDFVLSLFL